MSDTVPLPSGPVVLPASPPPILLTPEPTPIPGPAPAPAPLQPGDFVAWPAADATESAWLNAARVNGVAATLRQSRALEGPEQSDPNMIEAINRLSAAIERLAAPVPTGSADPIARLAQALTASLAVLGKS